ncbi:hypothetical protein [Hoeflea ulvae]|uniref:Uncharacterized protein n=1 Tax=Hoeflea ulvae TaxID=2983764 RepID=A0ABT3YH21_9HYPH|nr:hypothetical protein [Hoeflea ulvae]MCY0095194.1 hypothetical protein [Hoeflea ulvae]
MSEEMVDSTGRFSIMRRENSAGLDEDEIITQYCSSNDMGLVRGSFVADVENQPAAARGQACHWARRG